MSRYNRRTFPTRANIGGTSDRLINRLERRATAIGALHEQGKSKALRNIKRRFLHGTLSVRQRILALKNRQGETLKAYYRQFFGSLHNG